DLRLPELVAQRHLGEPLRADRIVAPARRSHPARRRLRERYRRRQLQKIAPPKRSRFHARSLLSSCPSYPSGMITFTSNATPVTRRGSRVHLVRGGDQ